MSRISKFPHKVIVMSGENSQLAYCKTLRIWEKTLMCIYTFSFLHSTLFRPNFITPMEDFLLDRLHFLLLQKKTNVQSLILTKVMYAVF